MGKKRRLKSAKAKFGAKHANHPRMAMLNKLALEDVSEKVETTPITEQETKTIEIPKVTPPQVELKKPTRPTPKRTTRKAPKKRRSRAKKKKVVEAAV